MIMSTAQSHRFIPILANNTCALAPKNYKIANTVVNWLPPFTILHLLQKPESILTGNIILVAYFLRVTHFGNVRSNLTPKSSPLLMVPSQSPSPQW